MTQTHKEQYELEKSPGTFVLSTCLRFELYNCTGSKKYRKSFFYVQGTQCIRRLLLVLTGLQSEIFGEHEIAQQVTQSIRCARDTGVLDEALFIDLQGVIALSEYVRTYADINTSENYSTIAAALLMQHLAWQKAATIAIIGGGYMAEKFFNALLSASSMKLKKCYWANRTPSRIEKNVTVLADLLDFDIEVVDLEDGRRVLSEADATFCALSNAADYYEDAGHKDGAFVVDVSWPPVFSQKRNIKLLNIANTNFARFMQRPIPQHNLVRARLEIDAMLNCLEQSA